MGRIIAIANQKGGVGKTTTTINLAASLSRTRRRVLLVDIDPQGNATVGSGMSAGDFDTSIYEVLLENETVESAIVKCECGYDLIPANGDLAGAQVELVNEIAREMRLKTALARIRDDYDYILIDCPPALNILTLNALCASDGVLIPVQCEYFALEGLTALVGTIDKIQAVLNPSLKIEGLLRTMFDGRNTLANEVSEQLGKHFGDRLYRTIIPRNVRLAEAPGHGLPALDYDPQSAGARAYLTLAGEILRREQQP